MNIIGIYPGKFQPPTLGNYNAYNLLKKISGTNTFVTTDDKISMPDAPLTFQDKQQIWTRHGVPIDKVVMSNDPDKAVEVLKKFGPDRTVAIFAMSKKEADIHLKNPRKFVLFSGLNSSMEPMNSKIYILIIPDETLHVHPQVSVDTIKKVFSSDSISEEKKKSFFKQIFGWYDISLFDLIKKKFAEASIVNENMDNLREFTIIRRRLSPFIKEVIYEFFTTPKSDQTTMTTDIDQNAAAQSSANAAAQTRIKKDLARKKLKDLEKQLDLRKKKRENDKKQGELDVKNLTNQVSVLKKEI